MIYSGWRRRSSSTGVMFIGWSQVIEIQSFHNRASQRFRQNKISKLQNSYKTLVSSDDKVLAMVVDYYSKLFTSSELADIEEVVQYIRQVVTEEMNRNLIRTFSRDEVEVALKQMTPLKVPKPNGMPPIFSRNFGTTMVMIWSMQSFHA